MRRYVPDHVRKIAAEREALRKARLAAFRQGVDMVTGEPGEICRLCGVIKCVHNTPRPTVDVDPDSIPF